MVFAGNRIKTKEKATPNYSGANMQDSNLAGIEHFRTRESSHPKKKKMDRGRNGHCWPSPAQIRT